MTNKDIWNQVHEEGYEKGREDALREASESMEFRELLKDAQLLQQQNKTLIEEVKILVDAMREISYRAHYPLCDAATGLADKKCACVIGVAKNVLYDLFPES